MTNQSTEEAWKRAFELFKLEYEQAAERYENIYKAIWQIFSYMGILAAGILTFGSKNSNSNLPIQVTAFIALTPLLFWFLAIYIPMNNYGEKAREHLGEIEIKFNDITENCLNIPWKLEHYKNFNSSKEAPNSQRKGFVESVQNLFNTIVFRGRSSVPWRVKRAIHTFGLIALIAWVVLLVCTIQYYRSYQPTSDKIELKLESVELTMQQTQLQEKLDFLSKQIDSKVIMQESQLQKLQNKLDTLAQQINSIESLIQDIKANSNQQ